MIQPWFIHDVFDSVFFMFDSILFDFKHEFIVITQWNVLLFKAEISETWNRRIKKKCSKHRNRLKYSLSNSE